MKRFVPDLLFRLFGKTSSTILSSFTCAVCHVPSMTSCQPPNNFMSSGTPDTPRHLTDLCERYIASGGLTYLVFKNFKTLKAS